MPRTVGRHVVPILAATLFVLPLALMISGSLRPIGVPPVGGLGLLPQQPTLETYSRLGELLPLEVYVRNSAVVVAVAVPVTILVASWTGLGIRLLAPRRRRLAVLVCLVLLLVPASALWTTRFVVYRAAGISGTLLPLVAPALLATSPFLVLIYAWAFAGVPDSHFEAARLEGATLRTLWRSIAMPQVRPATLAVGVLAFTFHWGNFMDALLYLQGADTFTLPLGLDTLKLLNPTEFPLLMAGAVLYSLPSVGAFLLAQRLFRDPVRALRGWR